MKKSENTLTFIPIYENVENIEFSSCAIPFKDIKEIMKKDRYMRIRIFKNKFWNRKENNNRPKFTCAIYSTTTEKEFEFEEDENIKELKEELEILKRAVRAYQLDGITEYLDYLDV